MYSPVGNIVLLEDLQARNLLPNYLLVLAHEVVQTPQAYERLLKGFTGTLILDNSLIELGKPADPAMIMAAASIVKPDWVVLPDVLNDNVGTRMSVEEATKTWAFNLEAGWMLAPQGKYLWDIMDCAENLAKLAMGKHAFAWGLPRIHTNNKIPRTKILNQLEPKWNVPIHLLGMSDDFRNDMDCFMFKNVMGIDSATPLRAGWENIKYGAEGVKAPVTRPRESFFTDCAYAGPATIYNMGFINGQIEMEKWK